MQIDLSAFFFVNCYLEKKTVFDKLFILTDINNVEKLLFNILPNVPFAGSGCHM